MTPPSLIRKCAIAMFRWNFGRTPKMGSGPDATELRILEIYAGIALETAAAIPTPPDPPGASKLATVAGNGQNPPSSTNTTQEVSP